MAASARIDELRSKFDDNPRRYFASLANEYRKAGDLSTAIAICRTQLRHHPTHMSGHVVLGQALFESGELDAARVAFERAVELDPENLIALRHLGDAAMARRDVESARRWYRRVLDIDPGNDAIATQLLTLGAPPIKVVEPESAAPAAAPEPAPAAPEPPAEAAAPEPEPARATGFVDFDPDELAWPAPASLEIPTVSDEVPAFIEAMVPPEPLVDAARPDDTRTHASSDATPEAATELESELASPAGDVADGVVDELDFVDGWATLSVADLSETIGAPAPTRSDIDAEGAEGSRSDVLDDPVVGLDLPPADDAGLRELAHVADVSPLETESLAVDEPTNGAVELDDELVSAELLTVESTIVEWLPAEPPVADDADVAEQPPDVAPAYAEAAHQSPEVAAPSAAPAPSVPPIDAETAPLDEVIASGAFVTETMAELCVQQGHDDEALVIYEQLVAQRPDDERLAGRLAAVRTRLRRPAPSASEPAGDYLRALAARRPGESFDEAVVPSDVAQEQRDRPEAGSETVAASTPGAGALDDASAVSELTLEYPTPISNAAIEEPATPSDEPSATPPDDRDRWAASAWSGAFRADAAPDRSLLADLAPRDATADLSFDRFFVGLEEEPRVESQPELQPTRPAERAPETEPAVPTPTAPSPEPAATAEQDPDRDLAEFNAWLRGLRDA